MKNIIAILVVFGFITNFNISTAEAQKVNTADFWQCDGRQGGSWTVGRAASICFVNPFQQPSEVQAYWSQITYDDAKYNSSTSVRNQENNRYATEMNALVEGFAKSYYKQRRPSAPSAEVEAWTKAILAVSYHESIWTHYRKGSDGRMRLLRGDFGHGHGLMQVDDRWHFAYVKDGGAARIQDNIIYGLDLYFDLWNKAANASCVGGGVNYLARTRATYSMYNGGEGSICRWRNTAHKWYKNDKNFWDHFQQQGWRRHVTSATPFQYNFSCFTQDGGLKCFDKEEDPRPPVVVPSPNPTPVPGPEYQLSIENLYNLKSKNLNCTWNKSFLSCLPSELGTQCLVDLFGIASNKALIDLESETSQEVAVRMINPDLKCAPKGDISVGDFVLTKANINLRRTPGGALITTIPANRTLQVLEIYINEQTKIIYYLVSTGSTTGYLYTGTANVSQNYTVKVNAGSAQRIIASKGEMLTITGRYGINMRTEPGGALQMNIPTSERLIVIDRVIRGEEGHVYYQVEYKNTVGYIYSGRLAPTPNIHTWTEVK